MTHLRVTLFLVSIAIAPYTATAQDQRWMPWAGCWELVNERGSVSRSIDKPEAADQQRPLPRVCVAVEDGTAVLQSTVGGQPTVRQTIAPDGTDRPFNENDCRGTQRASWSRSGTRVFSRADLTCADQMPRAISGLSLIAPDGRWLDVQSVRVGSRETTQVRQYRRAGSESPGPAGRPFTIEDVKEASAHVRPAVLEAVLAETGARFNLSSTTLIELADADVASPVIDVMVALSFPDRFVVERTVREPFSSSLGPIGGAAEPLFMFDDLGFAPAYFYTPFAYSWLGRFDPWYAGDGFVAIGDGGSGGPLPERPSGTGRVVNGMGYTQVRSRESGSDGSGGQDSAPGSRGGGTRGSASPQGFTRGGSDTASTSGSASGSGGASSGSSSSDSGSSSDGGRTAQPR